MAASANWRCADCDTYNGPAEASCTTCGGSRRGTAPGATAPGPAAKRGPKPAEKPGAATGAKAAASGGGGARPAAKRPGGGRPAAAWRCAECDTHNARTDLSCMACGTPWKAAAKKSAATPPPKPPASGAGAAKKATPGRTPPRKSPPRATPSSSSTARTTARPTRPGTSGTTGRRTSAAPGTARPRTEEGVFFPSSAPTGYRPTVPHTPPPAPVHTPSPRPTYTPPPASSTAAGCVKGCLLTVVALFLLGLFARGCDGAFDSGSGSPDGSDGADGTTVAAACPARIAAELPDGDGAELVAAYRTSNKQITLCRTASGALYYYGEFSDGRDKGIAMEAEETGGGYEAVNGPYRYEIHDGVVTIYQSGRQIGEEELTPEPSPS